MGPEHDSSQPDDVDLPTIVVLSLGHRPVMFRDRWRGLPVIILGVTISRVNSDL